MVDAATAAGQAQYPDHQLGQALPLRPPAPTLQALGRGRHHLLPRRPGPRHTPPVGGPSLAGYLPSPWCGWYLLRHFGLGWGEVAPVHPFLHPTLTPDGRLLSDLRPPQGPERGTSLGMGG